MNSTLKTRRIVESGLMIALSVILSMLKIYRLPWGGSVTLCSMLPMILLSYRYGVKWGSFSAFVYSLLQALLGAMDGTFSMIALGAESGMYSSGVFVIPYWAAVIGIILLDYVAAFTVLGLGGCFKKGQQPAQELFWGCLLSTVARYLAHILSGFLLFGTFASWFFGEVGAFGDMMMNSFQGNLLYFLYSVIYNGCYMLPEIIITSVAAYLIGRSAPQFLQVKSK